MCGVRRLALSSGRRCGGSLLSSGVASLAPARAAAAAGGASQALDERCGDNASRARLFERSSGAPRRRRFGGRRGQRAPILRSGGASGNPGHTSAAQFSPWDAELYALRLITKPGRLNLAKNS